MKLQVRRKFAASHMLNNPKFSVDWNINMYGACNKLHGHTWEAEVMVEGERGSDTGLIINFQEIKREIDRLDHFHLNDLFDLPTAENVCSYLLGKFVDMGLFKYVRVRIYESIDSFVEDSWKSE